MRVAVFLVFSGAWGMSILPEMIKGRPSWVTKVSQSRASSSLTPGLGSGVWGVGNW